MSNFDKWDKMYKQDCGLVHRILLTLFRKHFAQFASIALSRAYMRGYINSKTLHEIAAIYQVMLGSPGSK